MVGGTVTDALAPVGHTLAVLACYLAPYFEAPQRDTGVNTQLCCCVVAVLVVVGHRRRR